MEDQGQTPPTTDRVGSQHTPPAFVDWLLGTIVFVGGVFVAMAGATVGVAVDRDALIQAIEEETIETTILLTDLTEGDIALIADSVVVWSAIGLIVTGIAIALFGVGFILFRYAVRRRASPRDRFSSYSTYAVLGAIVAVAVSFIPFSTILGGGVAGYLEWRESERTVSVGGLAGVLPNLPIVLFSIFVLGGVLAGVRDVDGQSFVILVTGLTVLSLLVLLTLAAALGALGGYLGGKIAESR